MKTKAYPKYKPSGVEWLGEVPDGWEVKRLKNAFRIYNGSTPESSKDEYWDGEIVWYTPEDLGNNSEKYISESRRKITQHGYLNIGATIVTANSIIISTRAPIGHLAITTIPACTNQGCRSLVPSKYYLSDFFYYYLHISKSILNAFGKGTTFIELGNQGLGSYSIPAPPLPEQQSIASFLDRETGRIDTLIEKKQQLIGLLKEKRTALISRAVTKGLDPNVKMKPSGVEWLGEVPEHWSVNKISRISKICYGVGGEIDRSLEEGLKTISLPNIDFEGRLNLDDVPFADVPEIEKNEVLLRKGDLLFNWRNGSSEHLGKTALFDKDGEYAHVSFLLRIRFDINSHCSGFYRYLLTGYRITGFFKHSKAGVNNTFNLSELSQLPVFCPPLSEQIAISSFLDRETTRIDALISTVESAILKLKEYRTALISAAVTGKIDVSASLNAGVRETA